MNSDPQEQMHRENMEQFAAAELRLQKEAQQKNLMLLHRSVVVSFLAVLVAIIFGIFALRSKPSVNVQVELPKTSQFAK